MTHRTPFGEGAGYEYPNQAVVDAAVAGFNAGHDLDAETFELLADMPLRARWTEEGQGIITDEGEVIPLPDPPGVALYIRPGIRRLCAALDETAQGMWTQTILAQAGIILDQVVESSAYERLGESWLTIFEYEDDLRELLAEEFELQLVCFDSMDDSTNLRDTGRVIQAADRRLSPGGLLIIGGTVSGVGRQCLLRTMEMAHQYLNPLYDQPDPRWLGGFPHTQYAVFGK